MRLLKNTIIFVLSFSTQMVFVGCLNEYTSPEDGNDGMDGDASSEGDVADADDDGGDQDADGTDQDADGMCVTTCNSHCYDRVCGPTPATCDAPENTCGTCTAGTCNTTKGVCTSTHEKAGVFCKCESEQSCSEPCPTAQGAANTCITTDTAGNGFCSFECTTVDGAFCKVGGSECEADFSSGCCRNLGDKNFCLMDEYCEIAPYGCGYLDDCGTDDTGNCVSNLLCVRFNANENWGNCIYLCDCPKPDQDCLGATCRDNGKCMSLSDTPQTGKGACIPPGDRAMEEFCHIPDNGCSGDMICINFGENDTSGKGMCTSVCNPDGGSPCVDPMECMFPLQNGKWVCSRPCASCNKSECPNGGTGWQCKSFGQEPNVKYYCIPE
jgi:hypothetical protein